jgi:hypothetical protein
VQHCEVYLRKSSIYVVSESLTEFGIGVSVGPMFKVETMLPKDVGEAVVAALNASRKGIPAPSNLAVVQKELFRFTGAKSWGDLAKTSTFASVSREGSTVTATPHKVGEASAFVPEGPGIPCSSGSIEDVGRCVLKALKVAEGA